jgi:hypothetical protein
LEVRVMKITTTAIVMLLCSFSASAEEPSLYQTTVEDAPSKEGKPVTFTFKEIERTPTTSTVELSALVGGSVSGPMLMVKCMCGLTRARGEQFFTAVPLSRDPIRMKVTFPKTGPAPDQFGPLKPGEPAVFSIAQCDLLKF